MAHVLYISLACADLVPFQKYNYRRRKIRMKSYLIVDEGDRLVIKKLEDELTKLKQLVENFIETKKKLNVSDNLTQEVDQTTLSTIKNVQNR